MPTVLLITEQERLLQLFTTLEQEGMFRLRLAPTLAQGEEEIVARLPHYVFVENGISGLPGASIAGHLRGLLPEGAEVVLMARGAADTGECREVGGLFLLELSENDEALRRCIAEIIPRHPAPEQPPPSQPLPVLPKTAREFLSHEPDRARLSAGAKRLFWLIPLGILVISLGFMAYRARKPAPPVPLKTTSGAPPAAATVAGPTAASATAQGIRYLASGKHPAPTGPANLPGGKGLSYVVQPGDNLLNVLMNKYGFTHRGALGIIPELKRLNHLSDLDVIQPGQTIILRRAPAGRSE